MFVLFPLVTMVLGAWLLGEQMTGYGVIGAVVVMAGAWLGALSPDARQPVPVRRTDPVRTVLDSG
jgi:drug/metabolite transporter (DMT)-like permease